MSFAKDATTNVLASKERFQVLLDSAPVGILETDSNGRCVHANPKWLESAGMEAAEALGHGWVNAIHLDERDSFLEEWRRFLLEPTELSRDLCFQASGGTIRWMIFHASPIGAQGKVEGCVCTAVDITGRRRAEMEQKQAEIGRLADSIAHEINTPAQFIGDNLRFLSDAFGDLHKLVRRHEEFLQGAMANSWTDAEIAAIEALLQSVERDYLAAEIPKAIGEALAGVERVRRAVCGIKEATR